MANRDDMVEALRGLKARPNVQIELPADIAWAVMSQLQLACRVPGNTGPARRVAERLARAILAELANGPALVELAAAGWQEPVEHVSGGGNGRKARIH